MTSLRLGDWRQVLADIEMVDHLITDPPYSERTHQGQSAERGGIGYPPISSREMDAFVADWSPRVSGWMVIMTDDLLAPSARAAAENAGRLTFAPVPILQHRPRLQGDGPGSGTVWMCVSRPRGRQWAQWGSLPCWYESSPDRTGIVLGAKPLELMHAIIRDYSRPGDLICDPYAGGGTTLLAARSLGRRAVGAELDPVTHAKAQQRLAASWQPDLLEQQRTAP